MTATLSTRNSNNQPHQGRRTSIPLAGVLLVLCMGIVVPGCTTHLQGVSGPVAWQAADLRVAARSAAGAARDIYAFTLILAETQGAAITFTQLDYTVSQPDVNAAGATHSSSILWKLRPRGELRHPFSFYWYCADIQCRDLAPTAPWYNLVLTGSDDRGQPVRVVIDIRLPSNPPQLKPGRPQESPAAPPLQGASAPEGDADLLSFQTIGNKIFVHAALNQKEFATLLLDTGATHTFLTPTTAQRLGMSPTADAPRRTLRVGDGQLHEVPVIPLSALTVGEATVENLQVGISVLFPQTPAVDGLLGGDFLEEFRIVLDRTTHQMWLEPHHVVKSK